MTDSSGWVKYCRPLQRASKEKRPALADRITAMLGESKESADFGRVFLIGKSREPITGLVHMVSKEIKHVLADAAKEGPIVIAPDVELDDDRRAAFVTLWLELNGWLALPHAMHCHTLAEMLQMCMWIDQLGMPGGNTVRSMVLAKAASVETKETAFAVIELIKKCEDAVAKRHGLDARQVVQRVATAAATAAKHGIDLKDCPRVRFIQAALSGHKALTAEFQSFHEPGTMARQFIDLVTSQLVQRSLDDPSVATRFLLPLAHMVRNEMGITDIVLPKAAETVLKTNMARGDWKMIEAQLNANSPFRSNYSTLMTNDAKQLVETQTAIVTNTDDWTDAPRIAAPVVAPAAAAAAPKAESKVQAKAEDDFVL